jgi:hypothetical protein
MEEHPALHRVHSYLSLEELEQGIASVKASPKEIGVLLLIVRRPQVGAREMVDVAELLTDKGLGGDNWLSRGSKSTPDGSANPEMQLNVMNARVIDLITRESRADWSLAGDQLLIDLDLSQENLPPGTRLAIGDEAVIEVTAQPHTGCSKFATRFGNDALRWVNSPEGKALRLRGLCAKVAVPGRIRVSETVVRL